MTERTRPAEREKWRKLVQEMRDQAENLSPTNKVHPAPTILRWAREIERLTADRVKP